MNPAITAFWLLFPALIFLVLASISSPIAHSLIFLHSADGGGVSFGMWGWCVDGGACSGPSLGFSWGDELVHGLTYLLVLIPIACGLTFLALVSLVPVLLPRGVRTYPSPAFSLFALLAAVASVAAFVFMIALFATAYTRFQNAQVPVTWGAMPWLVLVAAILNILASLHSGCGTMYRRTTYVTYTPSYRY